MSYLIAKFKSEQQFFKVLALSDNERVFPVFEVEHIKLYDAKYKLEEEEYFKIQKFSEEGFCLEVLKREFSDTEYNSINNFDETKMEYIFWVKGLDYYFQRVTPTQVVNRKFLSFNNYEIVENGPGLVIKEEADAYYNKSEDALFFKNLNAIKGIFPGIDVLYREATDSEVDDFLSKSFIQLHDGYGRESVKVYNRKRIGSIIDLLNQLSNEQLESILDYVKKYCDDLSYDENSKKFLITSENDLKNLIFGIDQRYYTTEVSGEKRMANSVTKIGS